LNYSEITPEIFHVTGGFGAQGAIYGGLVILDNPIIVMGASGKNFLKNFRIFLKDRGYDDPKIRVYLPNVTFNELTVVDDLAKKLENIEIAVHKDLEDVVRRPRSNYTTDRFYGNMKSLAKHLPEKVENVVGIGKYDTFKTKRSKILSNPSPGPHKGHCFYLYEEGRVLASGILGKFLPKYTYYYLDKTSSFKAYREGIDFLEDANYDILFHSYDTPVIISDMNKFVSGMSKTTTEIAKEILAYLDAVPISFEKLYQAFMADYRPDVGEYKKMNFYKVFLHRHLDMLIMQKLVVIDNSNPEELLYSRK